MKRSRLSLPAVLCLALASSLCTSSPYQKVRLELTSVPSLDLLAYSGIVLPGFLQLETLPDLDLSRELSAYLKEELTRRLQSPVTDKPLAPKDEEQLKDSQHWKEAEGLGDKPLFLTGKAQFVQETRKAVLEQERGSIEEPFVKEKTWDVRKSYTLEVSFIGIDGRTGEPVFEKEYKEAAIYSNPKQEDRFALHDLMQRFKTKLFRDILGATRLQDRYLLIK